jgi:glycosyltransferase involved in cell wall biosynthesis
MLKFSVVIPVYNEEQTLRALYFSLSKVMDETLQPYEIIFVNDYSTDRSQKVLKSINPKPDNLIILNLNEHRGQSAAMQAGFDLARAEFIITMDGDLQNDPQDILKLWDKISEGYDLVCGWRYNRRDPWTKIWSSRIANTFRRVVAGENIHDVGCSLRIFKKELLDKIRLSGGLHRFFTLVALKSGYKITEVKVQHHPRKFGKSKYNIINRFPGCLIDFLCLSLFGVRNSMKYKVYRQNKEVLGNKL